MIGIAQVSPIDSGCHALIGGREIHQRIDVETAGGVRDQFARDEIDARVAAVRTVRELRELQIELPWKILADFPHLVLNEVIVVAQPVLGRDRLRIGAGDPGEELIGRLEAFRPFLEARQQRDRAARISRDPVRGRQRDSVRLELLVAEEWRRRARRTVDGRRL